MYIDIYKTHSISSMKLLMSTYTKIIHLKSCTNPNLTLKSVQARKIIEYTRNHNKWTSQSLKPYKKGPKNKTISSHEAS